MRFSIKCVSLPPNIINGMPNSKHRTSLKDLARELGVSIATVSRALRNSPEIGLEMQEKVKSLAKG